MTVIIENVVWHKQEIFHKKFYLQTKDDYLLEYSTLVIAHMSDEPRILFQLYKNANFLKRFFSIISSTIDPDTKYNCFKVSIYNSL